MNNADRKQIRAIVDGKEGSYSANELTKAQKDDLEIVIKDDNMRCPRCNTGIIFFNGRAKNFRSGWCNCCKTKVVVQGGEIWVNDKFMMMEED
jgi:hypothetical protein